MSVENQTVETAPEEKVETDLSSRLQAAAFGDGNSTSTQQTGTTAIQQPATPVQTTTTTQTQETKNEKPEFNIPEWLKTEFGVEDVNVLKQEREEFKKLKEQPTSQPFEFKDETSKQIHELLRSGDKEGRKKAREVLEFQERVDDLASLPVTKDNAADIIKLQMQLKNKQLNKEEIEFHYSQTYGIPKEPIQRKMEDEDEFQERMDEWKEKVSAIEQNRMIAAKLAQPELLSLKPELTLPEIKNASEQTSYQPTEEDLRKHKEEVDSFVKQVESSFNDFKGFSTQVKDKDVDYSVAYDFSESEIKEIKTTLQKFAEENFDVNALFADRWVTKSSDGKSGVLNIRQIVKDYSAIVSLESASSKIANEAANKRMEEHLKTKKNITLGTTDGNNTPLALNNQQDISARLQAAAFGSSN